ncbi:hypothetical protein GQ55_8G234300 [Panicum hallii var. hallii]|uniref:Uncharacterized protein n=1 Tax=Panicum hallii var. hallii TaxID=1504633 RepID=A0A2T7CQE4_9POAL|nr:hypothetical protein GQ55_8G234300 [Panicum hallii var. hallii]
MISPQHHTGQAQSGSPGSGSASGTSLQLLITHTSRRLCVLLQRRDWGTK